MTGIRERLDELLTETSLSDPHEITERIVDEMNSRELRPALLECMPGYVRARLGAFGRSALSPGGATGTSSTHRRSASGSSKSTKWSNARSVFAWRIHSPDGYKLLSLCSLGDVEFAASERHKKAKELDAWGDKFDTLAALMRERNVESVGQLSEAEVAEVLA